AFSSSSLWWNCCFCWIDCLTFATISSTIPPCLFCLLWILDRFLDHGRHFLEPSVESGGTRFSATVILHPSVRGEAEGRQDCQHMRRDPFHGMHVTLLSIHCSFIQKRGLFHRPCYYSSGPACLASAATMHYPASVRKAYREHCARDARCNP